jgi:hypothetical protein
MRAPTWGSRPHWVSSLTKSSQYQRSKGVKFGGMFVAGKNCQYYQKMNNKDMLLPLQVGLNNVLNMFTPCKNGPLIPMEVSKKIPWRDDRPMVILSLKLKSFVV